MGLTIEEDAIPVLEILRTSYNYPRPPELYLTQINSRESFVSSMPEAFRTLKEARSYVAVVMLRGVHFVLSRRRTKDRGVQDVLALFEST